MNKEDFLFSKRVTTSRQLKTISYDEIEDFEHGKPDLRLTLTRKQLEALSKGKVLAYKDQHDDWSGAQGNTPEITERLKEEQERGHLGIFS